MKDITNKGAIFSDDNKTLIKWTTNEEYVQLPDEVEMVSKGAFADCPNLKKVGLSRSMLIHKCAEILKLNFSYGAQRQEKNPFKAEPYAVWVSILDEDAIKDAIMLAINDELYKQAGLCYIRNSKGEIVEEIDFPNVQWCYRELDVTNLDASINDIREDLSNIQYGILYVRGIKENIKLPRNFTYSLNKSGFLHGYGDLGANWFVVGYLPPDMKADLGIGYLRMMPEKFAWKDKNHFQYNNN